MSTLSASTRRPLFPRGPGLGLKASFLCLLALGAILVDQRSDTLTPVRNGLTWALQPVLWAASLPTGFARTADQIQSRESLVVENQVLRENQLLLQARLQKGAALETENRQLRELLSSSARLEERVLIAEIVSAAQDPYTQQIIVNKGARDGVYKGQALVDAQGVMGQVIRVNPASSIALLITDPNHSIPVEINRTGLQTFALGLGDGQNLSLPYLPGNADVQVGDLLVSSALGGRFPAGYSVGRIRELKHEPGEHFMEALAEPAARLNQGRQALLVWSESFPMLDLPEAAESAGATPAPTTPTP
ncbi:MAG TPA: rod shape-determining protein MreC [Verrucomicrobiae bacterium]|nr:rod shape-determining protein MreC [Verrucomicrobiae bacterium]